MSVGKLASVMVCLCSFAEKKRPIGGLVFHAQFLICAQKFGVTRMLQYKMNQMLFCRNFGFGKIAGIFALFFTKSACFCLLEPFFKTILCKFCAKQAGKGSGLTERNSSKWQKH